MRNVFIALLKVGQEDPYKSALVICHVCAHNRSPKRVRVARETLRINAAGTLEGSYWSTTTGTLAKQGNDKLLQMCRATS
eukprot:2163380-Pyramimonas_sp.AAC.1